MSYVILYRHLDANKLYSVVSENAYGIREFDSRAAVEEYLEETGLLHSTNGVQVVDLNL